MGNDWKVYLAPKEPPYSRQKALLPIAVWREYKHLAKVSRSATIHRIRKGWSIIDAITTPSVTEDQSDNILAFLEKHPLSSRETISAAINKAGTTTLRFLELLERAGRVYKTIGKTVKNRPIYFYGVADEAAPEPSEVFDIEAEKHWKAKPYVNKIRQRALDDAEYLRKQRMK